MTITSYANLQAAISTTGKTWEERFFKTSSTPKAAGIWTDTWLGTGYPAAGASPGSAAGAALSNATTGAFPIFRDPSGADKRYLLTLGANATATTQTLLLVDRLVHTSNLSGTVATAQTINSATLTRYTTGEGVMLALVCWTPTGTTAATVTVSYTNQAGTASRTTQSVALWTGGWGGSTLAPVAGQIQPLPLQAGDTGVRSVQSLTATPSTVTAGSYGIILYKPLAIIQTTTPNYLETDYAIQTSGLPELVTGACVSFFIIPQTTTAANLTGLIKTVEG